MASEKYFRVTNVSQNEVKFVRAPKDALAILVAAGDSNDVRAATDNEIEAHFEQGRDISPVGSTEPKARYYFVGTELVRAKNELDAFHRLAGGSYKAEVLDQDALVEILKTRPTLLYYVAPAKPEKAAKAPPPAANDGDAQASDAPSSDAPAEQQPEDAQQGEAAPLFAAAG